MCDGFSWRQQVAQSEHLLDNLARRQVPLNALQAAGTEDTAHAAANLRTDTDRAPSVFDHQHALDPSAVATLQEQLVCPIGRPVVIRGVRAENAPVSRELT